MELIFVIIILCCLCFYLGWSCFSLHVNNILIKHSDEITKNKYLSEDFRRGYQFVLDIILREIIK